METQNEFFVTIASARPGRLRPVACHGARRAQCYLLGRCPSVGSRTSFPSSRARSGSPSSPVTGPRRHPCPLGLPGVFSTWVSQALRPRDQEVPAARVFSVWLSQAWACSFCSRCAAARWNHIGDIDGDGVQEIFAALHVRPAEVNSYGSELVRLSPGGVREWTALADDRYTFGDGEYGPPWPASDLAVYKAGGEPRIAWSLRHFTWWPSMVVTLNSRGERLVVFVNSG